MSCSKLSELSELNPDKKNWAVCVHVSRLWHHRGPSDTGPIRHTDIVLLDGEGNHMYPEISTRDVDAFIDKLQEGGMYEFRKFIVCAPKIGYMPVQAQYMIRFTRFTTVYEKVDVPANFPSVTFNLCPFADIPGPAEIPANFIDVIGIITTISDAADYHVPSRPVPSVRREISIRDLSGHEIKVVLWGESATDFNGDNIYEIGKEEPVVVIFVGTLPKNYNGVRGVGGSTACKWYINEDIEEINVYRASVADHFEPIKLSALPIQYRFPLGHDTNIENKTVHELVNMDLFDTEAENFACTVTITSLSPNQRWWFLSCRLCRKSSTPNGVAFLCSDQMCPCENAEARYRICVMASDGTEEAEFVLFGRLAEQLIGRPVMSVLRAGRSNRSSTNEILLAGRQDQSIPTDIAAVVTKKYRLFVSVTERSFRWDRPSFQVNKIDTFFGKQLHSSNFHGGSGSSGRTPFGRKNFQIGRSSSPRSTMLSPQNALRIGGLNSAIDRTLDDTNTNQLGTKNQQSVNTARTTPVGETGLDISFTEKQAISDAVPPSMHGLKSQNIVTTCLLSGEKVDEPKILDSSVDPLSNVIATEEIKEPPHPVDKSQDKGKALAQDKYTSPVKQCTNKRLMPSTDASTLPAPNTSKKFSIGKKSK